MDMEAREALLILPAWSDYEVSEAFVSGHGLSKYAELNMLAWWMMIS